jgi:hypothetical protein
MAKEASSRCTSRQNFLAVASAWTLTALSEAPANAQNTGTAFVSSIEITQMI